MIQLYQNLWEKSRLKYSANKNVSIKTSMLKSALSDYTNAYIVVKGRIIVRGTNDGNKKANF